MQSIPQSFTWKHLMDIRKKPISEIMTRTLCQVGPDQIVTDALARMRSKSVSSVIVVDGLAIRGIITERDIVRAVNTIANFRKMRCADLMQSPVVAVGPDTTCLDAYRRMAKRGIRHLAVVDAKGKVLGLASEGDMMRDFGIEYYMNFKDVGGVMSTQVCLLATSALVADAVDLMIDKHQSCVLVVDAQRRPLGVVTERDVVRLCSDHVNSELMPLGQVMQSPVKTVQAHELLHVAVKSMGEAGIRRLVVVDEAGAVRGLLTHHEIVRGLEGNYDDYFNALTDLQGSSQCHEGLPIDEKQILATLLRSTNGTAVLAADLDFRVSYLTATVTDMFGLRAADIMGADLRDTLKQAGWTDAHDVLCEAALTDGATTFHAAIGTVRLAIRVLLVRDAQDRSCGFLVLARRAVAQ